MSAGLASQAVALYRSLYELHLNFYVDWLAPENTYRHLSFSASADSRMLRKVEKQMVEDYLSEHSPQRAQELTKRAMCMTRWLGIVSKKAAFAPVGIAIHDQCYRYLSSVLHQDFQETASHANWFRSEAYQTVDESRSRWLGQLLNIVVSGTLHLVRSDIGN